MGNAVLAGAITSEGVIPILQQIEETRTSGVLLFKAADAAGVLTLVAGELGLEQEPGPDGEDPVEALLRLHEGTYEVFQRLPKLPVSKGTDVRREGSLGVHVPADLMNYCERAGLTGRLTFAAGDDRVEALYDRGELIAMRVEGDEEEGDVNEVFGWEDGTFCVEALTELPPIEWHPDTVRAPAAEVNLTASGVGREPTGQHVIEVALADIVNEREKRRKRERTGPGLPPQPEARRPDTARIPPTEATRSKREPTVKVIYLGAKRGDELAAVVQPGSPSDTRHQRTDVTGEVALPEATAARRRPAAEDDDEPRAGNPLVAMLWVALVLVVAALALALLGRLPALE